MPAYRFIGIIAHLYYISIAIFIKGQLYRICNLWFGSKHFGLEAFKDVECFYRFFRCAGILIFFLLSA
ncbi:hypothetical protein D3C87_1331120 [compost metagenome]